MTASRHCGGLRCYARHSELDLESVKKLLIQAQHDWLTLPRVSLRDTDKFHAKQSITIQKILISRLSLFYDFRKEYRKNN